MTLALVVLIQYQSVTYGRTDRRTSLLEQYRACVACYSWARPRGAQLLAGYTIFSTPAATLFLRRAAYFDFTSVPCHCPSASCCDLLRTDRRTDTRHDCYRHDSPASHSSSTQLKAWNATVLVKDASKLQK